MSGSESASVDDFNKDEEEVNVFAQVCNQQINSKLKQILKSMTGIEEDQVQKVAINFGQVTANQTSTNKQAADCEAKASQSSSFISQEAIFAAQDYITKVYGNVARSSGLNEIAKRQSAKVSIDQTNIIESPISKNRESEIEKGNNLYSCIKSTLSFKS